MARYLTTLTSQTAEPWYDNLKAMKVYIDSSWVSLARLTEKQSMIKKCKKTKIHRRKLQIGYKYANTDVEI